MYSSGPQMEAGLWNALLYGNLSEAQRTWDALRQRTESIWLKALYYATKGPPQSMEEICLWLLDQNTSSQVPHGSPSCKMPDRMQQLGVLKCLLESPIWNSRAVLEAAMQLRLRLKDHQTLLSLPELMSMVGKELIQQAARQGYPLDFSADSQGTALFGQVMDKDTILSIPTEMCEEPIWQIVHHLLALKWLDVLQHVLNDWPNLTICYSDVEHAEKAGYTDLIGPLKARYKSQEVYISHENHVANQRRSDSRSDRRPFDGKGKQRKKDTSEERLAVRARIKAYRERKSKTAQQE
eukprot:jgi/Botrbrau1/62/Bobra.0022s0055.1